MRVLGGLIIGWLLLAVGVTGVAKAESPSLPPRVSDERIAAATLPIELPVGEAIRVADTMTPIDHVRSEGIETVVDLSADILFAFASADVVPRARVRIGELVGPVPRGTRVEIHGHTDPIGSAATNQRLSLARAQAVSAIVASTRPDLRLAVQGFGETRPVADNGTPEQDNPEGRARNRRVEIRYRA